MNLHVVNGIYIQLITCFVLLARHVQHADSANFVVTRVNLTHNYSWPYYCHFCSCTDEGNTLYTDCTEKGLFKPPRDIDRNTSVLIMHRNVIKVVKYAYFVGLSELRTLDLSFNMIYKIEIGSFQDLIRLDALYLHGNIFTSTLQEVIRPGVFSGLDNLTKLTLHKSIDINDVLYSRVPGAALMELRSLKELSIDGVVNARFGEEFLNLTKLTTLTMSGYISKYRMSRNDKRAICEIGDLTKHSFEGLPHLLNLTLRACRLKSVDRDSFASLSQLSYLDLSWNNDLEFEQFGDVAYGLTFTNVSVLNISGIHNPYRAGTEILRSNMQYFRSLRLSELYMDDNGIEFIDYGVFSLIPRTIKILSMRKNRLNFGFYISEAVFNNPGINIFDAGDQNELLRSNRMFYTKLDKHNIRKRTRRRTGLKGISDPRTGGINGLHQRLTRKMADQPIVLKLQTLICSGSRSDVTPLSFANTVNNITYIDISKNFIPYIKKNAFNGLKALKYLDISDNFVEHIQGGGLMGLDALDELYLDNNLLGYVLANDRNGELFSHLTHLHKLYLSKNRISKLDENVFRSLHYLQSIDLSDNYIENMNLDLTSLCDLKNVNVSNNRIQSIPEGFRETLSHIAKGQKVTMDLTYNKLACNCDTISFLKWLFASPVQFVNIDKYYCSLTNGSVRYLNESSTLIDALDEECKSYLGIILGCSILSSFVVSFIISYTVYNNRWKLRYLYYMAKVTIDKNQNPDENDLRFDYDIFLSYGDGDRHFVVKDATEHLERNEGLRLNIRDRDFEIGEMIAVNISKAIRTSKKTFLLLSRHFLTNKWCNFEMNMARMESIHAKRQVLVIVFLETIQVNVLPLEILDLLRECPSVDLPKDEQLRPAFWQQCVDYVKD